MHNSYKRTSCKNVYETCAEASAVGSTMEQCQVEAFFDGRSDFKKERKGATRFNSGY